MGLYAAIAVSLFLQGLFNGAEMILVAADRHKLAERARGGNRGASVALRLLENPDRALATTLTGTNIFVVLATVLATSRLLPRFGEWAAWVSIGVVTPLVVLFGGIVPKTFAQARANRLAGAAARFIRVSEVVLYPVVALVTFFSRLLSRPFGGIPPLRGIVTREELRLILSTSRSGSDVEAHERAMVRRVFDFGETEVADIFRPLVQVVALPESATCRDAAALSARWGYSRYPVYRERIDHVVGYLHLIDVVGRDPDEPILPLMRKALYVPEVMPIDELLRRFQEAGVSFAVVVDEYGGVTGIVTAEDVVEEVVGEIEDEYEPAIEYYKRIAPGEFLVLGRMEVDRFAKEIGVRLPEGEYSTVGGMLIAMAERIPRAGEEFRVRGVRFTVEEATERAVKKVRVRLPEPAGESSGDGGWDSGEYEWEGSD
ncbi:MAG: hemolysin family protein [Deltaproteobacteria bacterium]